MLPGKGVGPGLSVSWFTPGVDFQRAGEVRLERREGKVQSSWGNICFARARSSTISDTRYITGSTDTRFPLQETGPWS
eukprot:3248721-Pyramimonas_sp.AAC.1